MPADLTAIQIGLMTLVLVLPGMTKGVLGGGLPLVAAPLLSQIVPVPLGIMTLAVSTGGEPDSARALRVSGGGRGRCLP